MLDFNTLQVAGISSRLAFFVVFLVTLLRHPREIYFGIWAGALSFSLIASFLMLGDPPSVPLNAVKGSVVYILYGSSLAVSWVGLRLFHERTPVPLPALGLALFSGLSYGLLLQAGASMSWSLSAVFGCIALCTALCIWEILRTPAPMRLWTQYIVLAGFGGYFCVFLLSIGVVHFASERLAAPESGIYSLLFDLWCGVFIQVGYLAMVSERAHVKLSRLADTDPLTGLANRRGLFAAMSQRAGLSSSQPRCAILLADIDHFKAINDDFGHATGDAVLVRVAELCRVALRETDLVGRIGGEEFMLVIDGATPEGALITAERVRQAIATADPVASGVRRITASFGVAAFHAGADGSSLMQAADDALYAAKHGGRNTLRVAA